MNIVDLLPDLGNLRKDGRNVALFVAAVQTRAAILLLEQKPDDAMRLLVEASVLAGRFVDAAVGGVRRLTLARLFGGFDPCKEMRQEARAFARAWALDQRLIDALG